MVCVPLTDKALPLQDTLSLCPFRMDDAQAFLECTQKNIAHLSPWMPEAVKIKSLALAAQVMEKAIQEREQGLAWHCGLWEKERLIGYAGLYQMRWDAGVSNLGYWLDAACTSRGLARMACAALLDFGFQELGLRSIEVHSAVENKKSAAVPMGLGFTLSSVRKNAESIAGIPIAHNIYQLDAGSWKKREEKS